MLRSRIIPTLLLQDECLVKTRGFKRPTYVGDPANTVKIFNEFEVDELLLLDIGASRDGGRPNLKVLKDIADECFMPLGYGGGIKNLEDAKAIFDIGIEKVAINSAAESTDTIEKISNHFGSQAVIASIDVKKNFWGRDTVRTFGGTRNTNKDPVNWARELEFRGCGEILLTSIDREGSWEGFNMELVESVIDAVDIPVIVHGGAGNCAHVQQMLKTSNASAVAVGSMVIFQKKNMGVLVNFPKF